MDNNDQYNTPYTQIPQQTINIQQQGNNVTTIGGWIGYSLLTYFLWIIGPIIMILTSNDESVKNYAKAQLIIIAAVIAFYLVVVVGFLGGIGALLGDGW